jgi:hypothetical protein
MSKRPAMIVSPAPSLSAGRKQMILLRKSKERLNFAILEERLADIDAPFGESVVRIENISELAGPG